MNGHLTELQKHDAAYGTSSERHCGECGRAVDALRAEREALGRMLAVEAPPAEALRARLRRRGSGARWWLLVPAAALALAFLRVFFIADPPQVAPAQDHGAFVERLVRELKSPSQVRRGLAEAGLRACGAGALAALDASDAPVAKMLAEDIRRPHAMRQAEEKLATVKVTFAFKDVDIKSLVDLAMRIAGLEATVDPDVRGKLTLSVNDVPVGNVLETALKPLGFVAAPMHDGTVRVTTPERAKSLLPARAPLALPTVLPADVDRRIAELGAETLETRDAAERALSTPGAEEPLWKALDGPDREVALRAERLLKLFYSVPPAGRPKVAAKEGGFWSSVMHGPLGGLPAGAREKLGLQVAIEPGVEARGINVRAAVRLQLDPGWDYDAVHGIVYIFQAGRAARSTEPVEPLLWLPADRAKVIGDLIARGDEVELRALGAEAVVPLRYAARVVPKDEAARCARIADEIVRDRRRETWFIDEPSSWRRRGAAHPDLEKRVSIAATARPLADVLKDLGAELEGKGEPVTIDLQDVPLGVVLDFIARPRGLDVDVRDGKIIVR